MLNTGSNHNFNLLFSCYSISDNVPHASDNVPHTACSIGPQKETAAMTPAALNSGNHVFVGYKPLAGLSRPWLEK
jgi:hypothetical protein